MEQIVLHVLLEQERPVCPLLSPCPQHAELALPPAADPNSSQVAPQQRGEVPSCRQRHTEAN